VRTLLLAALLAASAAARAAEKPEPPAAPPRELLDNLDFFKDYADTAEDGMWEAFDVVSSTQAFLAEPGGQTEEVVKP
jgi:hypothetical protein